MKAFIFDMDGVIIDSEPIHARAKVVALREFGIDLTAEDLNLERYVGRSAKSFFGDMAAKYPIEGVTWETMAAKKHEIYKDIIRNDPDIHPIDGVEDLMQRLKAAGYTIGLGSSSMLDVIHLTLTRLDLLKYFDQITGGDEVAEAKPDPAIFLLAAKKLGANPADCTVIDDANSGTLAAKAAGMYCIGYYNPHSGAQDLSAADVVVKSHAEVQV